MVGTEKSRVEWNLKYIGGIRVVKEVLRTIFRFGEMILLNIVEKV